MLNFTFTQSVPCRLRTFLRQQGISGTLYKAVRTEGFLTLNGSVNQRDVLLQPGDRIELSLPPEETTVLATPGPLTILYEDADLLIVDKPAGMLVHPTTRQATGTLANLVAGYLQAKQQLAAIHPVSRLDKNTSGLVLFAKHAFMQYALSQSRLHKEYLGVVQGVPEPRQGTIDAPIARQAGSIITREVNKEKGAAARTDYAVVTVLQSCSLVRFTLQTGRTHQIRVHASYLGHPLVGDNLYGTPGPEGRQLLHASRLSFVQPYTRQAIDVTCPLPADILAVLNQAKYAIINIDQK